MQTPGPQRRTARGSVTRFERSTAPAVPSLQCHAVQHHHQHAQQQHTEQAQPEQVQQVHRLEERLGLHLATVPVQPNSGLQNPIQRPGSLPQQSEWHTRHHSNEEALPDRDLAVVGHQEPVAVHECHIRSVRTGCDTGGGAVHVEGCGVTPSTLARSQLGVAPFSIPERFSTRDRGGEKPRIAPVSALCHLRTRNLRSVGREAGATPSWRRSGCRGTPARGCERIRVLE